MIKINNKKASHVGIVLSLVIFVGFLLFLYVITEPALRTQRDKQVLVDALELKITEQLETNLTTATFSLDSSYDPDITTECLRFYHPNGLGGLNLTAKDENSEIINTIFDDTFFTIELPEENQDKKFFKLYYSKEEHYDHSFSNGRCEDPAGEDYSIASVKIEKKVFETKIIDFINMTQENYENIKELMGVPPGVEFGFSFTYGNETTIGTEDVNVSLDIYVEKIPVEYVDKNATVDIGKMIVKLW